MTVSKPHAPVKWAQRPDSLYVTIDLPDVTGEKLDLKEDKLSFSGKSQGTEYEFEFEFIHEVNPEKSTWKVLPRSIQMHLYKKDDSEDAEPWVRLLKDKHQEKGQVSIDWNKWVDDDEEPEAEKGGFDMSALNGGSGFGGGMPPGMGGMPGMEGMGGPAMENMAEMMKQYNKKKNDEEQEEEEEDSDDEIPPE